MSGVVMNMSFEAGKTLVITGMPQANPKQFSINIGENPENLALQVNPRFDANGDKPVVVFNSCQGGKWLQEQRDERFSFKKSEEFKVKITFTRAEFLITLPDGTEIHFPNRNGAEKYPYVHFIGDVRIIGVDFK